MIQENIYQQIVFGIRQLVNGEGGSGRIMDMSVDADNNAVVVELAEMTDSFREALMDDIHEQLSAWRVNPFKEVAYEGSHKLIFYLLLDRKVEKAFNNAQI
jgi:divalent metal cation (Fe/Co/Zn/Cd) transporter